MLPSYKCDNSNHCRSGQLPQCAHSPSGTSRATAATGYPTKRSRRPQEQLKVDYGLGTVAHRSADTVVARVATADDVFALGIDVPTFFQLGVEERLDVQLECK